MAYAEATGAGCGWYRGTTGTSGTSGTCAMCGDAQQVVQGHSHLLPRKVLLFKGKDGYDAMLSQVPIADPTERTGAIDKVMCTSSTGVEMLDFWHTTLSKGPLATSIDLPLTLDGMGYVPVVLLRDKRTRPYASSYANSSSKGTTESADPSDQPDNEMLVMRRVHNFYSELQKYHILPIDRHHHDHYYQLRIRAHPTPLRNSIAALMQLLCTWCAIEEDQGAGMSTMNLGFNTTLIQWNIKYEGGFDEALVRFARCMMTDARRHFDSVRHICQSKTISMLVDRTFDSHIDSRQAIVDALTDVFQNYTYDMICYDTSFLEMDPNAKLFEYLVPANKFADKELFVRDGRVHVPVVRNERGKGGGKQDVMFERM